MTAEEDDFLALSIKEYTEHLEGWKKEEGYRLIDPVIVNSYNKNVIGGHQRLRVLQSKLNQYWIHKSDIRWVKVEDENKEKALNLALNKISGKFNEEKLEQWINELSMNNFDLRLTGFNDEEVFGYLNVGDDFENQIKYIQKKEIGELVDIKIGDIKGFISSATYNILIDKINRYKTKYELLETALEKIFKGEDANGKND
jgi:hypothetical protein